MPTDRRTFLRHVAALGLLGPVAGTWGCGTPDADPDGDASAPSVPAGGPVTRPDVAPGDAGTVHILAPTPEPPVAYLSRAHMRVYLDPAYRDWAEHRLAAYVSVTTGLWRIPRPEDDPRVPIIPGDALREFEVVDIGLWDSEMTPSEGDTRLRLGAPVAVRVELSCVPLPPGDAWISAPTLVVQRRDGPTGDGGREDFLEVGTGTRHGGAECGGAGEPVRLLTWAVPTRDAGSSQGH